MVGSTISTYQITRVVGQSRANVLLEATGSSSEGHDNAPVLLQLLSTSLPYERFARDLRWARNAIRELAHPDIVSIEAVEQLPGDQLLLRLTYTEGVTLQQRLEEMRQNGEAYGEEEALAFVAQIARVLTPALRRGLVHRTLDPHHILVRLDDSPAIVGLDLPVPLTDEQLAASEDEFLAYRSPEQQQGLMLDGRSNIYSLGMLLYAMLSGVEPQQAAGEAAARQSLRELRPDLSPATYRVVEKALQLESWARYQTYDELLGAMGMVHSAAPPVRTPQVAAAPRRNTRLSQRSPAVRLPSVLRNPQLVAALAALLLLLAAGLVWGSGAMRATQPDNQMVDEGSGDDLSAPLLPRERESPSPIAPRATESVENIAAGVSATPSPTATVLPSSPTPQPTTSSDTGSPPPPAATATPQATSTPRPTATPEPTSTNQPPPPPPQPTETPEPTATTEPTPTVEPTSPPPPPPPPPPQPTATPPPAPTSPPPPTATPPLPVPPSPTSETAPLPSPTATQPLASDLR